MKSLSGIKLSALLATCLATLAACGSSELEPADGSTIQNLSYEFSISEEPIEGEPVGGKITIDSNGIYTELIYTNPFDQTLLSETKGKLEDEQLQEITKVINDADFENYSSKGGFCPANDRYKLSVVWSDETKVNGVVNHEAFKGDYDGECGSGNSIKGDMKKVHQHLLNIKESFTR